MNGIQLEIFVPYLGCACMGGPPDPAMEAFNQDLLVLKEEASSGLSWSVYGLNQHMAVFKARPEIAGILRTEGRGGLPVILLEGRVVFKGGYPSMAELRRQLGL